MTAAADSSGRADGGRIFFSGASRSLMEEDEIRLTSVGVDIGSSTAHLLFSRITLERLDTRYVVVDRAVLHASDILLTPYLPNGDIDAGRLAEFVQREYARSGVRREDIDAGALILTGVEVRRRNARAIGEVFAAEAGRFVSVSAGDRLETVMAAHGSGAVAASADGRRILNVDVGGGTTKLALCQGGAITAMTVVEAGARLLVTDGEDRIIRLEDFGARAGRALGLELAVGGVCDAALKARLAQAMAARIGRAVAGREAAEWLRLPPLTEGLMFDGVIFSGGVSEYVRGAESGEFGDLGPWLGRGLRAWAEDIRAPILPRAGGIRATVIGASQYTAQVSGSTIYFDPEDVLPLRDLAVIRPALELSGENIDADAVTTEIGAGLARRDLADGARPVALALNWSGSATYRRLDDLSRGLVRGLNAILARGHPLVMVADSDVGGLLGMHCRENRLTANAIVSIDGVALGEFDFIDIGQVIRATGSAPVVIKSLIFPGDARLERARHG